MKPGNPIKTTDSSTRKSEKAQPETAACRFLAKFLQAGGRPCFTKYRRRREVENEKGLEILMGGSRLQHDCALLVSILENQPFASADLALTGYQLDESIASNFQEPIDCCWRNISILMRFASHKDSQHAVEHSPLTILASKY